MRSCPVLPRQIWLLSIPVLSLLKRPPIHGRPSVGLIALGRVKSSPPAAGLLSNRKTQLLYPVCTGSFPTFIKMPLRLKFLACRRNSSTWSRSLVSLFPDHTRGRVLSSRFRMAAITPVLSVSRLVARGASHSRTIEDVLVDIQSALMGGAKEIVLTGVHVGSWGQDLDGKHCLADLISAILDQTVTPRLRLSSLEPWDLGTDFFGLWSDPRLCRHLHLPLQSGSASVLKRMRRKTTPASFAELVESARSLIPEVAITTDVIAGFPGETQAEFEETLEFVKSMNFAGGHVFSYSARPGTAAARIKSQVPHELRKVRNAALRAVFSKGQRAYQSRFIGKTLPVLWEAASELADSSCQLQGLTDNYIRVSAAAPTPRWNQLDAVKLISLGIAGMKGEITIPDTPPKP